MATDSNGPGNDDNLSSLGLRRLQLDELIAKQEYEIRSKELQMKAEEAKRMRWSHPLLLGIAGAIIATSGNLYGNWLNTSNQITVEANKNSSQRDSAERKAEADRILEAIKLQSTVEAAGRLSFLIKVGLITDPNRQAALQSYLTARGVEKKPDAESVPSRGNVPEDSPGGKPGTEKTPVVVNYESGWLGGGNNQSDQCAIGRMVLIDKYPGKSVNFKSSSEQSKKDFLGRVEYLYRCVFEIR